MLRPQTKSKSQPKKGDVRAATGDANEILIYGDIGASWWSDGVVAKDVAEKLAAMSAESEVIVRINSPGGDAFEGVAIYNLLKDAKQRIVVKVDGVALSAASIIAMAGAEVRMAENALMMIHDPWTFAMGNSEELRDTAETLDKVAGALAATYVRKTGKTLDAVRGLMAAETWLSASEAKDEGFVDAIDGPEEVEPTITDHHCERFRNVPRDVERFAAVHSNGPPAMRFAAAVPQHTITAGAAPAPNEEHMSMKAVCQALGLREDASEASVLAAIDENKKSAETHKAKADALDVQNKSLASERDKALQRASVSESKLIEGEVDALVGVKIAAAEREVFIKLAQKDREMFDALIAQRAPMAILQRDPAKMGAEPPPAPLAADNGEDFAALTNAVANG